MRNDVTFSRRLVLSMTVGAVLLSSSISTSWAQECTEVTEQIQASDPSDNDEFGTSVSVMNDLAAIGVPRSDLTGTNNGAVILYDIEGQTAVEETVLVPSSNTFADLFGWAVAISEAQDIIVVGAVGDDEIGTNAGAAYVFRHNGTDWIEEAKLTASDGISQDSFGESISISGDTILIGVPFQGAVNAGKAYVYRYDGSNWNEEATLFPSDGNEFSTPWNIGASVAIDGDVAIVGAPRHWGYSPIGSDTGVAYIFRRNGTSWSQEQALVAADSQGESFFGEAVELQGDVAIVGSPERDDFGSASGAAYVFRDDGNGNWTQEAKLVPNDPDAFAYYGHDLSMDGTTLLVSAPGDAEDGFDAGAVYHVENSGTNWTEAEKLLAPNGGEGDRFGWSTAISGQAMLIGALWDDDGGTNAGSVIRFDEACVSSEVCATDLDGDHTTGASDLALLLGEWGPSPNSPADISGDGSVAADDLSILLGAWGPCN